MKYQTFINSIASKRDRAALRSIFSMFLTDDDPPKLKDLTLGSIVLSGTETTQILISGTCTTGINITGACSGNAIKLGVSGTPAGDFLAYGATALAFMQWDASADELVLSGQARINLSGCSIKAADTDGGVIKCGTSAAPVTEDTANMKFMSFYFDDGATSGEAIGQYLRLYVTGAGGEGIAMRGFCTVLNVAAVNARGAHFSLSFGASGGVTGLGCAVEATLHIPSTSGLTGTVAAVKAAINSDAATSDPVGARLSAIQVVNQGDATGMADVDDDCALFDFLGWTVGDGNMIAVDNSPGSMPNATHSIKVRLPDNTSAYLYLGASPVTA